MNCSGQRHIYRILILFFIFFLSVPEGHGQIVPINGVINSYSKVTAVGDSWVELDNNLPGFAVDDKVLLIQMKGAELSLASSIFGSTINDTIGYYGYYEFILIDAVSSGPDRITFKNDIKGSYDPESFVQLVTVPQYDNALVNGMLTSDTWDEVSGTGGVLTFMADNNVYLDFNIDVSEKGFEGGASDIIQGLSINGVATGDDPNLFDFTEAENKAAHKGKGVASHIVVRTPFNFVDFARGKGRFGSGGGGGNGLFAGGGGGSSYGTGGQGGTDLEGNSGGGLPGEDPNSAQVTNKYNPILMGGGGGAGGKGPGGTDVGSDGGRGGGIIIILADTIFGNGKAIISNGASVWPTIADNNGGAGGGGAAGAIVISASYKASSALTIIANGGDGGHTYNFDGYGAGGSGGLVFTNKNLGASGVTSSVIPGRIGQAPYTGIPEITPSGTSGQVSDSLLIRLNGFLFNTIVSEETQSRVDSICSGESAPMIIGSEPAGGSGSYDIKWIRKKDSDLVWDTIPGETGKDMDLTVPEDDTVYFKRVVFDALQSPKVIDVSKQVEVIVQPLITGNSVGYDTIICWNQDPDQLLPIDILGGGNFDSPVPDSLFSWRKSTVNNTDFEGWDLPDETNNERDFDPDQLITTTYYYRAVQSGVCSDTSDVITVTVLPSITGNTIGADEVICEDRLFTDLTGPEPVDGDGSYIYEWRISNDDIEYSTAAGTVNQIDYNPVEGTFLRNQDQMLRRFVWSGADNVCFDSSNVVTLKMWSDITGNNISADQTITDYGLIDPLTGTLPGGGDPGATSSFKWEQSPNGVDSWIDGTETFTNDTYEPVGLADSTWYRRIVWRGECTDTSNTVVINVHHAIGNDFITTLSLGKDTIICRGQDPAKLIGSTPTGGDLNYTYRWEKSIDNILFEDADGVISDIDYDPPPLITPTYFRRNVSSGESSGISDTITINVLDTISDNIITGDQTICYNTGLLLEVGGDEPLGGAGPGTFTYLWEESIDNITWGAAMGTDTNIDYDPGVLTNPMYYRRIAISGLSNCCIDTSNTILVGIHTLPIGVISSLSNNTTCADDEVTLTFNISAGQAPYDIVFDNGFETIDITATADSYDYKFNPVSSGDFTDYVYQFISLIDNNNCAATNMSGVMNHKVYKVPEATISPLTPVDVCGLAVTLVATPSVGSGIWSSPDILTETDANAVSNDITVQNYGTFTFTWEETNVMCVDASTIDIKFWEQVLPVDAGLGETLPPLTSSYMLNADPPSVAGVEGLWTTVPEGGAAQFNPENSNLSEVTNLVDGQNVLKWTVKNGDVCIEVSDTIILNVKLLIIPSGFSPNGDDFNPTFYIDGLDNLAVEAELVITDMSGLTVYSNPKYHNDWDGRDMESNYLPDGTYYYFLRISAPNQRQLKGYVIIKRNLAQE